MLWLLFRDVFDDIYMFLVFYDLVSKEVELNVIEFCNFCYK